MLNNQCVLHNVKEYDVDTGGRYQGPWRVMYHLLVSASPQIMLVSRVVYAGASPLYKKACYRSIETTKRNIGDMSGCVPGLRARDVEEACIHLRHLEKCDEDEVFMALDLPILRARLHETYQNLRRLALAVDAKPGQSRKDCHFWLLDIFRVYQSSLRSSDGSNSGASDQMELLAETRSEVHQRSELDTTKSIFVVMIERAQIDKCIPNGTGRPQPIRETKLFQARVTSHMRTQYEWTRNPDNMVELQVKEVKATHSPADDGFR